MHFTCFRKRKSQRKDVSSKKCSMPRPELRNLCFNSIEEIPVIKTEATSPTSTSPKKSKTSTNFPAFFPCSNASANSEFIPKNAPSKQRKTQSKELENQSKKQTIPSEEPAIKYEQFDPDYLEYNDNAKNGTKYFPLSTKRSKQLENQTIPTEEPEIKYEEFDPDYLEEFDPEGQFEEFEPEHLEEFDPEGQFEEFEPEVKSEPENDNEPGIQYQHEIPDLDALESEIHGEPVDNCGNTEISLKKIEALSEKMKSSEEKKSQAPKKRKPAKSRKPREPHDPPDSTPKNKFHCTICGAAFHKKIILQSHFTRKHSVLYNFSCEVCQKKFKVKSDLTTHMRLHSEPPAICDVCGKSYKNSRYLYLHQRYAHLTTAFPCTICKRFMATQENLNQHIQLHHTQKERVMCDECGKSYSTRDTLKRHIRYIHNKIRKYECEVCSKKFVRRSELRQHLLIHTGKRHFACDICGQKFTQKPGLLTHRKKHPGEHPPLPIVRLDNALRDFNTK